MDVSLDISAQPQHARCHAVRNTVRGREPMVGGDGAAAVWPADAGLPLQRFSMLRSTDAAQVEPTRAVVARLLTPHRLTLRRADTEMSACLSAVDLGPVSLVHMRSGGHEVQVHLTEQVSYYDVNIALAGSNRLEAVPSRSWSTRRRPGSSPRAWSPTCT
jgi:hypothetical protein